METASELVGSREPNELGLDADHHADGTLKRKRWEFDNNEDYDEADEDADDSNKEDRANLGGMERGNHDSMTNSSKRARRHAWQSKYEMDFGLIAIERDAVTDDVTLAMCGFCKAFGREGKYEQLIQETESSMDTKKRRRRSLTTTKFFRAFRVDNIRSHLQGAHPRRWAEFELLPKQETIRSRFFEFHYEGLPIVEDVVLAGSNLNSESDLNYGQAHADALTSEAQMQSQAHRALNSGTISSTTGSGSSSSARRAVDNANTTSAQLSSAVYPNINAISAAFAVSNATTAQNNSGGNIARPNFSFEKHLQDRLDFDRERLAFDKAKFKHEIEMREQTLMERREIMEQDRDLFEKKREFYAKRDKQEEIRLKELADTIRDAILTTIHKTH
uniref:Uncharacterized protein AlNc14C5G746 n=1 Tax=Albugo laibachii Nc14 TaxID=890382 RepID=F0W0W6_9STRA|nr:conserved hypothetical protein [Albugo laibachii Nc14]|eukprot:CCA14690.1 conserved hypothetical protein [Albugo laibachii Nc14]